MSTSTSHRRALRTPLDASAVIDRPGRLLLLDDRPGAGTGCNRLTPSTVDLRRGRMGMKAARRVGSAERNVVPEQLKCRPRRRAAGPDTDSRGSGPCASNPATEPAGGFTEAPGQYQVTDPVRRISSQKYTGSASLRLHRLRQGECQAGRVLDACQCLGDSQAASRDLGSADHVAVTRKMPVLSATLGPQAVSAAQRPDSR
jgi:hypothetical protein